VESISDEGNRSRYETENTFQEKEEEINDNTDPTFQGTIQASDILVVNILPIPNPFFNEKADEMLQYPAPKLNPIFVI